MTIYNNRTNCSRRKQNVPDENYLAQIMSVFINVNKPSSHYAIGQLSIYHLVIPDAYTLVIDVMVGYMGTAKI